MDFIKTLLKTPSAWVPIAMSLASLVLVISYLTIFGIDRRDEDEGAAAHIWQLLIAGQLPIIAFFFIKYFPIKPKQTLWVLALQIGVLISALSPVFILGL